VNIQTVFAQVRPQFKIFWVQGHGCLLERCGLSFRISLYQLDLCWTVGLLSKEAIPSSKGEAKQRSEHVVSQKS
jgi:hypothetical protein